jgi:hypothetical protein
VIGDLPRLACRLASPTRSIVRQIEHFGHSCIERMEFRQARTYAPCCRHKRYRHIGLIHEVARVCSALRLEYRSSWSFVSHDHFTGEGIANERHLSILLILRRKTGPQSAFDDEPTGLSNSDGNDDVESHRPAKREQASASGGSQG